VLPLPRSAPHPQQPEAAAWLGGSGGSSSAPGIGREGRRRRQQPGGSDGAGDEKESSLKHFVLCLTFSMGTKGRMFGGICFVWFHSGGAGVPFQCPPRSEQLTLLVCLCSEKLPDLQGRPSPNPPAASSSLTGSLPERAGPVAPHQSPIIKLVGVHHRLLLSLAHQNSSLGSS